MSNMIAEFQSFMRNPMQYMAQRGMNIPQEYMQNPQQAIQYLMNSGRLSQDDFNRLQQQANQIQSNPAFKQLFNK